jgi:DNA invertase Pin-like site-specific DNA recombinase
MIGADNKNNAVILARVSSKSQEDEGYSLDSQLKLLQGYCERNNLNVVRVFKIAETASKDQSRKVFHEMLAYLSKGDVFHLAVEKTDRFTRNFKDAVAIDDWLEQDDNRRLHAVKENLLLHKNAKSDVKFMWNIHLSVAKKYTDNLREEAMKGWAEKLAQGWLPSVPPPGYMTVTEGGKRIHVPNPATKELMQKAFELYLEPSQSIASVTKALSVMGVKSKNGRPFAKSYIQAVLLNPFYIGINRFNGKDYPGAQEPIIDKRTFEAVQRKMHQGRPAVYAKHNPVFKSLIHCADCGTAVTWQLQKGRYYGICKRISEGCRGTKMLREDAVEELVIDALKPLACVSDEVIEWVAASMREELKDELAVKEKLVASVQAQLDRLDRMDDTLYDDKLAGEISQERYEAKRRQLSEQEAELRDQLVKVTAGGGCMLEQKLVILELAQKAARIYPYKTAEQKRLIMSKLFKNMTLKGGSISVEQTNFVRLIAQKVQITNQLMEAVK